MDLYEKYEVSLEKWSDKLGKAKKDVNLYRMESMEAKLEGDMFIEDVMDGIQRMEFLKKQIDMRFDDSTSIVSVFSNFQDRITSLCSNDDDCTVLGREDKQDLFAAFTAYLNEHEIAMALLSAQVEAGEAAVKKYEQEERKRDAYIKKVTNIWQKDLSKQTEELFLLRKKMSVVECECDSYRHAKESQVAEMQRELNELKTKITLMKNSQQLVNTSNCKDGVSRLYPKQNGDRSIRDDSTDEETENASYRSDHDYEMQALRGELMVLKREISNYLMSNTYYTLDCRSTSAARQREECSVGSSKDTILARGNYLSSNRSDKAFEDSSGQNISTIHDDMNLSEVIKKFRSQHKLHTDYVLSLQQQVSCLQEEVRFKQSEVTHLQSSLAEKNAELKDNHRNVQRTMESLRAQIDLMQSNLQTQKKSSTPDEFLAPSQDQHDADSLSRVRHAMFPTNHIAESLTLI